MCEIDLGAHIMYTWFVLKTSYDIACYDLIHNIGKKNINTTQELLFITNNYVDDDEATDANLIKPKGKQKVDNNNCPPHQEGRRRNDPPKFLS